jgi:hypothetical protein
MFSNFQTQKAFFPKQMKNAGADFWATCLGLFFSYAMFDGAGDREGDLRLIFRSYPKVAISKHFTC